MKQNRLETRIVINKEMFQWGPIKSRYIIMIP